MPGALRSAPRRGRICRVCRVCRVRSAPRAMSARSRPLMSTIEREGGGRDGGRKGGWVGGRRHTHTHTHKHTHTHTHTHTGTAIRTGTSSQIIPRAIHTHTHTHTHIHTHTHTWPLECLEGVPGGRLLCSKFCIGALTSETLRPAKLQGQGSVVV